MPQGDYEGALKRALHIYRQNGRKSLIREGVWCRVVGMLMQTGWDDATVIIYVIFIILSMPVSAPQITRREIIFYAQLFSHAILLVSKLTPVKTAV